MPAPDPASWWRRSEALLPRWRRPSLLQARKADPIRDATPAPRLTFDHGLVGPLDGHERRLIRYRVVRLLDTPDELRGAEIGYLDQGDEVQLLEKYGVYWLVLCPDGRQGWVHKMTLGEVVDERRRARARRPPRCRSPPRPGRWARTSTTTSWRPTSESRRRAPDAPRGSLPQHQDVLVDDVRHERPRIAVRPQPRPRLVPDEVALGDEPDGRGARGQVRAGEQVAPVLVGVAHDDDRVAPVAQHAVELAEDRLHPVEEGRVVGGVGQVVGRVA